MMEVISLYTLPAQHCRKCSNCRPSFSQCFEPSHVHLPSFRLLGGSEFVFETLAAVMHLQEGLGQNTSRDAWDRARRHLNCEIRSLIGRQTEPGSYYWPYVRVG
jgi:hypothetical protein